MAEIVGIPTVWEYNYKILFKNFETGREMTISCEDKQTDFFIVLLLNLVVIMT